MKFGFAFAISVVVFLVGVAVNHIDDTDETYGYWEPLHFLLEGVGMQTWEYTKTFAIRTYSFIFPLWTVGVVLKFLGISGVTSFMALRAVLAIVNAFAVASLTAAVDKTFGNELSNYFFTLLIASPGVFFVSTSFLPSAVGFTLIALSTASLLRRRFELSIMWGSFAVLWTGWPFVGVILLPFGLAMLGLRYTSEGFLGVLRLAAAGVGIVLAVGFPPMLIDYFHYGHMVSPTWNILKYNAMGSGDELYGVEPASYYVLNLLLTLGFSWPLSAIQYVYLFVQLVGPWKRWNGEQKCFMAALSASSLLWLIVLFSRPHKEERFLYPVYSLVCFQGSLALYWIQLLVRGILLSFTKGASKSGGNSLARASAKEWSQSAVFLGLLVAMLLGISRVTANYKNYHGYIELWNEFSVSYLDPQSRDSIAPHTTVCTGGEWYLFPNHFFMPPGARLAFVEDTFHGLLPRYFEIGGSTNASGDAAFNDRNAEERSRYVDGLETACDFVVAVVEEDSARYGPMMTRLHSLTLELDRIVPAQSVGFKKLLSKLVVDPARSQSSIFRAYYIPILSHRKNAFKEYAVYIKVQRK